MTNKKAMCCPFCGDDAARFCDDYSSSHVHGWVAEAWIECESCGARGPRVGIDEVIPEGEIEPAAIMGWNDRWGGLK